MGLRNECGEFGVLRQCVGPHALHRQQTRLPFTVEEQALLRAVAQVALVNLPAAHHALTQAQLLQKVLHLGCVIAWHGQVVCAQWASDTPHRPAPAVATGLVFQLQKGKVVHALALQRTRRCQPGHATTGNDDAGFVDGRRGWPGLATLEQMAAPERNASEVPCDVAQALVITTAQQGQRSACNKLATPKAHRLAIKVWSSRSAASKSKSSTNRATRLT